MKGVPERVDESGVKLVNGGPCHLYGGGAPQQKINTRACGLISQTISPSQPSQSTSQEHYETDEDEFTGPGSTEHSYHQQVSAQAQLPAIGAPRYKNTAKQKMKVKTRACQGYNLGYLSMWWKRMDREGKREEEERKRKEEEAKRRAHVKRWLSTKKDIYILKKKMSTKQRLGPMGSGEGGDIPLNILRLEQHPETRILLGGGETEAIYTGEPSPGFVAGMGVVTNADNIICERFQPINYKHAIFEQHQGHGTDKTSAVIEVSLGARESESNLQSMSQ